jgi:creatinine amidohydrolase
MRLADLAYPDLDAVGAGAVALLPLGATEAHGPHAPLGTDTLISVAICERAAARLEGEIAVLVLPAVAYGVTRYAAAFPGTVSIGEETLRTLVTEICSAFERAILVNSHFEPEQVETLRETGLPLLDLTKRANAERLTDEFREGSCHAGRYETSLVLADRPELVDEERMGALPPNPVSMPEEIAAGRTNFLALGMDRAYSGSPAEATAAEGEETFETLTDMLVELVREVARS